MSKQLMNNLFRTKSLDHLIEQASVDHSLRRVLGPWNLISLGVGAIIGAGIFVLTGHAAASYAGPAIVLSFVLSALACALAGLCYAEFASLIPIAGSAYTYSYATVGELFAWIIGWDLILEYALGATTVAIGWSGYVVSFLEDFGIHIPPAYTNPTGTLLEDGSRAVFNVPAAGILLLVTFLLVLGIRESALVNNLIVVLKVAVILAFILVGLKYVNPDNWSPFIPENTGKFGEFGWSGILRGAGVIFFAYIGFDAVSTAAQEARHPQRDMPIGILGSLAICTVLYILVSLVLTGLVPYRELGVPDPIAVGIDATGVTWLAPIVKIGAIAGLTSVILVMLLAQPRIFFTMARDGLLPPIAGRVHPKYKTPHVTTLATGITCALAAGFLPIHIVGELVSIGTLFAFTLVCLAVLVLRYKRPDLPRPFRTPLVPWVPLGGVACCLAEMVGLPWQTWERLIIWLAAGLVIYFAYGYHHSRAAYREELAQPAAKLR